MSVPLERRRVNIKLPLELDRKVENDMGTRGIDKISWIREAVAEKLDRIDRKRDRGWGPLTELPEEDRKMVLRLKDCLLHDPSNHKFRSAVDANLAWLMETVKRARRQKRAD